MSSKTFKNGMETFWYDPGDEYGYTDAQSYLEVEYDNNSIHLTQLNTERGFKKNYAPSDYSDEHVMANIFSSNKKEYKWIVNHIIDAIKNFEKEKGFFEIYKHPKDDSGQAYYTIIEADYDTWSVNITLHMERGLSQHYIEGQVQIDEEAFKNLKNLLFKIKKQYKI